MKDLIININFKDSTPQGCIIETFTGEIKNVKKRTFSGPLKDVDVLLLDSCDNLTHSALEQCKSILSGTLQISRNKYFADDETLNRLIKKLDKSTKLYYKYKGRSLNEIVTFIEQESCTPTSICICKTGYVISQNNIIYYPLQTQKKLGNYDLITITPSAELFLEITNKKYVAKLLFSYNGYMVPSNNSQEKVYNNAGNVICMRNMQEEKHCISILKNQGWKKSKNNTYYYDSFESIGESIENLLNNNFKLYTKDNKKILPSASLVFNTNYGIDWLELNILYNNQVINEFVDFKSKKRYVELTNGIVFLPDSVVEKSKMFRKADNKIIASKNHVGDFFELFYGSSLTSNFDENSFIDYESMDVDLPCNIQSVLRPYQTEGVKWLSFLYTNGIGGCLADDMGLGKTLQAIAFLSNKKIFKNNANALIIVPKTLIKNWENEFKKYNPQLNISIYHGLKRSDSINIYRKKKGILLSTYNTILHDIEIIKQIYFDCVILDEVQYIKNSKSKTYNAIKQIGSKNKIALSGTPFENNLNELWAIMDLLNQRSLGSKSNFTKKYRNTIDSTSINLLKSRIRPFILRRLKNQVLKDLPLKNENTIICSMTDKQRELYSVLLKSIKDEINRLPDRYEIKNSSMVLESLTYLRQVCCHPSILKKEYNINKCNESDKYELFKDLVSELQTNKKKVIVFSQFTSMLKIMVKWANAKHYNCFYIDGKTSKRQDIVNQFENSDTGVFFISLKAGGVGLNLVSCQYAILYDPWWNPAAEKQAADRIYRIGQKKNVFIYKLITENSIEEKIQDLQNRKNTISDDLFSDLIGVSKFTYDDLVKLIDQ